MAVTKKERFRSHASLLHYTLVGVIVHSKHFDSHEFDNNVDSLMATKTMQSLASHTIYNVVAFCLEL